MFAHNFVVVCYDQRVCNLINSYHITLYNHTRRFTMAEDELDEEVLSLCLQKLGRSDLTLSFDQLSSIKSVILYERTTVILGTGSGKSIVMHVAGLYLQLIEKARKTVTIIISPLLSVVSQQTSDVNNSGDVASVHVDNTVEDDFIVNQISSGLVQILYFTPETYVARKILIATLYKVHCISP